MVEEDEDLVLGHSPLDEYLQEVIPLSFSKYDQYKTDHSENFVFSENDTGSISMKEKLFDFMLQCQLHQQELLESCVFLLKMSCLTDDDENLLKDVKEEINKELLTHSSANYKLPFAHLNKNYVYFGVLILILSLIYGVIATQCFENLVGLFSLVVIIILCVWRVFDNKLFSVHKQILESVKVFHDTANSFDCFLDKAVSHLKEVEIINHGIMVFRFDTLKQNIDKGSEKNECLRLRNVTMDNLSSLFLMIRTNQRVLLQNQYDICEFDYKEEYLSQMSLESFSDVLQCSMKHETHDIQCLPLDRIKTMIYCYRCMLSELVYKVTVSLYLSYVNSNQSSHDMTSNILWIVHDITKNMVQASKQLESALNNSVKLIFKKQNDVPKRPSLPPKAIDTLLHSSQVHLYSALARIDEIKEQLGQDDIRENDDIIRNLLVDFSLALENSKVCIDDALLQRFPITREAKEPLSQVEIDENETSEYVKLFESVEPEGDVLYEGDSEAVVKTSNNFDQIEELEKALKDSRESRKLMKELKIILSAKDTPVGLLPFPLQKPSNAEIDSDEEFTCGTDSQNPKKSSKSSPKSAYCYEPSEKFNADAGKDDDHDTIESMITRFGLPTDFPCIINQNKMIEETFGSSDDET